MVIDSDKTDYDMPSLESDHILNLVDLSLGILLGMLHGTSYLILLY
jgi:hypothetical protein